MNCQNCGKSLRAEQKFCPACGTPAQAPSNFGAPPADAPPAQQIQTSWDQSPEAAPRRKSRAGKILLVVFGVFLLLAVVAGVAVYFGVRYFANTVKSSEPYRLAERELRESPLAAGALGEIRSVGFPLGAYNVDADGSGQAAFTMSVEGEKGSGQYVVTLVRVGGQWRVQSADLRLSGGQVVKLKGGDGDRDVIVDVGDVPPPPPPPAPTAPGARREPVRVPGALDLGALDDKAQSKPAPPYPNVARAVNARGKVVVQVTVDESGEVIMAAPSSGHPLLQAAALAAARQARFAPTLKDGRPVKVIGTLTYEFE